MQSLIRRIERLEGEIGTDSEDTELYNWEGYRVEAKVVRWPTKDAAGEAILPDGSHKPIAPASGLTLEELIKQVTRRRDGEGDRPRMTDQEKRASREAYRDVFFLRIGGRVTIEELLGSRCRGHDPEEWAKHEEQQRQHEEWLREHPEFDHRHKARARGDDADAMQ